MQVVNSFPKMNTDVSETGCCPRFISKGWNNGEIVFKDKLFVKMNTVSFFYIPLNMGLVMKKMQQKITAAGAQPKDQYLMLSRDLSPWKCEQLWAVSKEVPDIENIRISGNFLTKVFEGEYKMAPKWIEELKNYVKGKKKQLKNIFLFYTTCPKCYKYYGKNYVVAFAQV